jgi:hypothetical protein
MVREEPSPAVRRRLSISRAAVAVNRVCNPILNNPTIVHGVVFGWISELCHIRSHSLPEYFSTVAQAPWQGG